MNGREILYLANISIEMITEKRAVICVYAFIFGASAKWLTCGLFQGNINSHKNENSEA